MNTLIHRSGMGVSHGKYGMELVRVKKSSKGTSHVPNK